MTSRRFATFEVAERLYGVDVGAVQEILRPQPCTPIPLADPAIAGILALRGELVTAVDLRRRIDAADDGRTDQSMNVVLQYDDELVSLLVDTIGDVLTVDDDQLTQLSDTVESAPVAAAGRRLVTGAYQVDGRLLHVLDLEAVLDL